MINIKWNEIYPIWSDFVVAIQQVENYGYFDDLEYQLEDVAFQFKYKEDDETVEFDKEYWEIKLSIFNGYIDSKGIKDIEEPTRQLIDLLKNHGFSE